MTAEGDPTVGGQDSSIHLTSLFLMAHSVLSLFSKLGKTQKGPNSQTQPTGNWHSIPVRGAEKPICK